MRAIELWGRGPWREIPVPAGLTVLPSFSGAAGF
jgi:hypothetical protein